MSPTSQSNLLPAPVVQSRTPRSKFLKFVPRLPSLPEGETLQLECDLSDSKPTLEPAGGDLEGQVFQAQVNNSFKLAIDKGPKLRHTHQLLCAIIATLFVSSTSSMIVGMGMLSRIFGEPYASMGRERLFTRCNLGTIMLAPFILGGLLVWRKTKKTELRLRAVVAIAQVASLFASTIGIAGLPVKLTKEVEFNAVNAFLVAMCGSTTIALGLTVCRAAIIRKLNATRPGC